VTECGKWFQYRERKYRYEINRSPPRSVGPGVGMLVDIPLDLFLRGNSGLVGELPTTGVVGATGMINPSLSFPSPMSF